MNQIYVEKEAMIHEENATAAVVAVVVVRSAQIRAVAENTAAVPTLSTMALSNPCPSSAFINETPSCLPTIDTIDDIGNLGGNITSRPEDPTNWIQFWVYGVILPCIAIPGMFANMASFIVFTRPQMRSSINTYLAGLSFFDFFLLFLATLIYPTMTYCVCFGTACNFFNYAAVIFYPLSLIAQFGSVWTCVAITIDRFIAIQFPLKTRQWCTAQRACIVLFAITILGVLYRVPAMFELRFNSAGQVYKTELRLDINYRAIYKTYAYLIVMFLTPFAIMIVLNIFVVMAVRKAYEQRKRITRQNSSQDEKERRCTLIALFVIITFVIFTLLPTINNLLEELLIAQTRAEVTVQRTLVFLGNLFTCINSATNFLIYCALGKMTFTYTNFLSPYDLY